jgi:hypothetical protein
MLELSTDYNVPPGVKLSTRVKVGPRGEAAPQGWTLSHSGEVIPYGLRPIRSSKEMSVFTHGGERKAERSPLGVNYTPGCQTSALWLNSCKNLPQEFAELLG